MSLSHNIFSLPPEEQQKAIMSLARTAVLRGRERAGSARDEFDRLTRPLLHAKHEAGASKDELKHFSSSFMTSSSCFTVSFQVLLSNLSNVSSLFPLNFSRFSPLSLARFRRFQNTRRYAGWPTE